MEIQGETHVGKFRGGGKSIGSSDGKSRVNLCMKFIWKYLNDRRTLFFYILNVCNSISNFDIARYRIHAHFKIAVKLVISILILVLIRICGYEMALSYMHWSHAKGGTWPQYI